MKDKRVKLGKTDGEENEASLGTKYTTARVQDYLLQKLPITFLTFAGQVVPLNARREIEEAQDRTIISLAAFCGLPLVILAVMMFGVVKLWCRVRGLEKECTKLKSEIDEMMKKEREQAELNSSDTASSSGIDRSVPAGITHVPRRPECDVCIIPTKRKTDRRPAPGEIPRDTDPTISIDEAYPRMTQCPTCGEWINIWSVRTNANGNIGRRYAKCSKEHFMWCDEVIWIQGRKVLRMKQNL